MGAVAGVALSYFLSSEPGKALTEELHDEILEFKTALKEKKLIPDETMTATEIISHVVAQMAEYESLEDAELKKTRSKKRKKVSPTLAKSPSKKKQKKFSGV